MATNELWRAVMASNHENIELLSSNKELITQTVLAAFADRYDCDPALDAFVEPLFRDYHERREELGGYWITDVYACPRLFDRLMPYMGADLIDGRYAKYATLGRCRALGEAGLCFSIRAVVRILDVDVFGVEGPEMTDADRDGLRYLASLFEGNDDFRLIAMQYGVYWRGLATDEEMAEYHELTQPATPPCAAGELTPSQLFIELDRINQLPQRRPGFRELAGAISQSNRSMLERTRLLCGWRFNYPRVLSVPKCL